MVTTTHFTKKMSDEQTLCGEWVISVFDKPDTVVYNIRFETEERVRALGGVPCELCLEREPLADLAGIEL